MESLYQYIAGIKLNHAIPALLMGPRPVVKMQTKPQPIAAEETPANV